jgi:hypothetical protein
MNKFMKMEDNGDGSSTMEVCFDGENIHTFLLMISLDEYMEDVVSQLMETTSEELIDTIVNTFVAIPENPEGASNVY